MMDAWISVGSIFRFRYAIATINSCLFFSSIFFSVWKKAGQTRRNAILQQAVGHVGGNACKG